MINQDLGIVERNIGIDIALEEDNTSVHNQVGRLWEGKRRK